MQTGPAWRREYEAGGGLAARCIRLTHELERGSGFKKEMQLKDVDVIEKFGRRFLQTRLFTSF